RVEQSVDRPPVQGDRPYGPFERSRTVGSGGPTTLYGPRAPVRRRVEACAVEGQPLDHHIGELVGLSGNRASEPSHIETEPVRWEANGMASERSRDQLSSITSPDCLDT